MKKYLIALDLDGTLLIDWQTMCPKTVAYLKELKKDGHELVIATGRPFRSSEKFHKELGLTTPIINYNGGLVTSKKDPSFKPYSLTVPREYIIDIFNANKDHIHNAFGEVIDDIYLYEDTEEVRPLLHYFNGARLFVGSFEEILNHDTNGFIIIANKDEGHFIEEYVAKNYKDRVLCRNWGSHYNYILELYTPQTNKGAGLKYVADYLGYNREDIIAIGDAHNDIDMLKYAGRGIAMINGHDSLKAVADEVTEYSNLEQGIVKHLKKIL